MEKKETILAVDDNEVNLIMLRAILSQYYEVITASDGTQAEIMAIERNPDLILLDVMMPVKNGFETCKTLKTNDLTKNIPVIFLTASSDSESIVEGLGAGAVDYVCKPFSSDELLARIKHHVSLVNARKELDKQLFLQQQYRRQLEEKTEMLKLMGDNVLDSILICDFSGMVLNASKSTRGIFNIGFDLENRQLWDIAQTEEDKTFFKDFLEKLASMGEYSQKYILHKNDRLKTLVLETKGKTINKGQKKLIILDTRNITASAKSEARVRRNLDFQRKLRFISLNVNNIHGFMASCAYLVNSLMELINADEIFLLLGRKDKWTEFFYHNRELKTCKRGKLPPSQKTYPKFIEILKTESDNIICNIQDPYIPNVISSRSSRYVLYPIIVEGMLVGVFYVSRTSYGSITQENVYALANVANLVKSNISKKFYERRIIRQEKEITSIFKYSANGIISINKKLEVQRYNRRFLELFGLTEKADFTFKKLDTIIKGEPLREIQKLVDKVTKPPLFETTTITLTHKDGSKLFLEATLSKVPVLDDMISLLVFTDVTGLRNMDSAIMGASAAAEEKERTRLAQELHDGLGALLSSINIYINLILSGGVGSDEIFRTLKLTKGIVGQAIESVKEIADNLHPVILSRFGLVATINNIIEGLEDSRLIRFGFSHCDFHPLKDRNLELTVYRIINELINNTMKHAHAKNVAISLLSEENHLILEYVDDGIGFDFGELPKTTGGGRGIENIIGRVKAVNGKYSFKTKPKKGLIVWIEIPILQCQK